MTGTNSNKIQKTKSEKQERRKKIAYLKAQKTDDSLAEAKRLEEEDMDIDDLEESAVKTENNDDDTSGVPISPTHTAVKRYTPSPDQDPNDILSLTEAFKVVSLRSKGIPDDGSELIG